MKRERNPRRRQPQPEKKEPEKHIAEWPAGLLVIVGLMGFVLIEALNIIPGLIGLACIALAFVWCAAAREKEGENEKI